MADLSMMFGGYGNGLGGPSLGKSLVPPGYQIDPATGQMVPVPPGGTTQGPIQTGPTPLPAGLNDPTAGRPAIGPNGEPLDPSTGWPIDPKTGAAINPTTGRVQSTATATGRPQWGDNPSDLGAFEQRGAAGSFVPPDVAKATAGNIAAQGGTVTDNWGNVGGQAPGTDAAGGGAPGQGGGYQAQIDRATQFVDSDVLPDMAALRDAGRTAQFYDQDAYHMLQNGGRDYLSAIGATQGKREAGLTASNQEADANLAALREKYAGLDASGQAAMQKYLQETDPQMAERLASSSDAGLVGQQQGVFDQYKQLSNPAVTAQERYLGELARQQFEQSDKSNRDAVQANLKARGLRSGGAQIAAQRGAQQQMSNERMMSEMGMASNAVGRSMTALQGAGTVAGAMRNADDLMKQASDKFKQDEAARISKLAGERKTGSDATDKEKQTRADQDFDAGSATIAGNDTRNSAIWAGEDTESGLGYDVTKDRVGARIKMGADEFDRAGKVLGGSIDTATAHNAPGMALTPAQQEALDKLLAREDDLRNGGYVSGPRTGPGVK